MNIAEESLADWLLSHKAQSHAADDIEGAGGLEAYLGRVADALNDLGVWQTFESEDADWIFGQITTDLSGMIWSGNNSPDSFIKTLKQLFCFLLNINRDQVFAPNATLLLFPVLLPASRSDSWTILESVFEEGLQTLLDSRQQDHLIACERYAFTKWPDAAFATKMARRYGLEPF